MLLKNVNGLYIVNMWNNEYSIEAHCMNKRHKKKFP